MPLEERDYMEFGQKLQSLRKQKGLTQEELAKKLFVSRTAISKWESDRGYPNIDSLKAIAAFFSVTIDDLISGEEAINLAEQDSKQKENYTRDLVFSLADIGALCLLFLPLFAQRAGAVITEVSLLNLTEISLYLKIAYFVVTFALAVWGVLTLSLQNCQKHLWALLKSKVSLVFNIIATLLFILSLQPYAAIFSFLFLIIKVLLLIKWR